MPTRINHDLKSLRPLRLFLSVLAVAFIIELAVMFVLPYLVPPQSTVAIGAFVDAALLTIVLAPLLWFLIVQPLNNLAANRLRLLALTMSAQENERRRIARDLHDSLGQSLTGLMVGLRTIEDLSSDPQVKMQASELRRIGGETHDSIRRLARGLRPAILDDLGLVPALERYLEDLATAYHLKIEFLPECDHQSRLPLEKETSVFRIVQEATTNAIRHGHPQNLQIRLQCDTTEFRLTIADDGCGFNVAEALKVTDEKSPFGLLSIYERSLLLGGAAVITSLPNMGTQVKVRFPLETTENGNG